MYLSIFPSRHMHKQSNVQLFLLYKQKKPIWPFSTPAMRVCKCVYEHFRKILTHYDIITNWMRAVRLYNCPMKTHIRSMPENIHVEKFYGTIRRTTLQFDKGSCSWMSWSIKQQVFVLCRRHGQGSELQRAVSSHWATEQVGDWDWLLSAQSSAAVFTAFVCCSLSSRRYAYVCVCVCLSVCLLFPVRPREDWEFSVSVRRRILAGALLILSLLIPCCCSKGGKKIEALAMAART